MLDSNFILDAMNGVHEKQVIMAGEMLGYSDCGNSYISSWHNSLCPWSISNVGRRNEARRRQSWTLGITR